MLGLDKSTMSRTINNIVENNLVIRETHTEDRRYVTIALTEGGEKILKSIPEGKKEQVLERLDSAKVNTVAAFTTAGAMNKTKDIYAILKGGGINVSKESLAIKFAAKYHVSFISIHKIY